MVQNFTVIPSHPFGSLWVYCSWWQHAANLASYEQQDAHEFFISMLDGIHEKVEKDLCKPHSQGKLFSGEKIFPPCLYRGEARCSCLL